MRNHQEQPTKPHDAVDDDATIRRPPRTHVCRLFAAALDDDPIADEELRDLAPWDPAAAAAFEALTVAQYFR